MYLWSEQYSERALLKGGTTEIINKLMNPQIQELFTFRPELRTGYIKAPVFKTVTQRVCIKINTEWEILIDVSKRN